MDLHAHGRGKSNKFKGVKMGTGTCCNNAVKIFRSAPDSGFGLIFYAYFLVLRQESEWGLGHRPSKFKIGAWGKTLNYLNYYYLSIC
jgi:hypothetical protein